MFLPGDVLLFSGETPADRVLEFVTHSRWSHCGIIIASGILAESAAIYADGQIFHSTRIHCADALVPGYDGAVTHLPLQSPLNSLHAKQLLDWHDEQATIRVQHDFSYVAGLGLDVMDGLGLLATDKLSRLFSSQFVTQALQAVNVASESLHANRVTPDDVGRFPWFAAPCVIKTSRMSVALTGLMARPRSTKWPATERAHKRREPTCQVCGTERDLEAHHIIPFWVDYSLELDPGNLITLCRPHHWLFGHFCDPAWKAYNLDVRKHADEWRSMIAKGRAA